MIPTGNFILRCFLWGGEEELFLLQSVLDRHGTLHRIPRTGKLRQLVVDRRIHHSAPVQQDQLGHKLLVGGRGADGRLLFFTHEAAVTLDIGNEDRGDFGFHTHGGPSSLAGDDDLTLYAYARTFWSPNRWYFEYVLGSLGVL